MSTWPTTTAAVADALIAGPGQNPAVGSLLPRTGGSILLIAIGGMGAIQSGVCSFALQL